MFLRNVGWHSTDYTVLYNDAMSDILRQTRKNYYDQENLKDTEESDRGLF
jgi:hypothetical protein